MYDESDLNFYWVDQKMRIDQLAQEYANLPSDALQAQIAAMLRIIAFRTEINSQMLAQLLESLSSQQT